MPGPWAFLFDSPLTLALWLSNRIVTWTGLFVLWRKLRHTPNRIRRFFQWGILINMAAWAMLGLLLWKVCPR